MNLETNIEKARFTIIDNQEKASGKYRTLFAYAEKAYRDANNYVG